MMRLFLVSTHKNDASYEVLKYDVKSQEAILKGKYSTITMTLDIQSLQKAGYKLVKELPNA